MPKSSWDWLALVCTWVGSVVLALRAAGAPLLPGMPALLAANFWSFVPVTLISIAGVIYLYRLFRPQAAESIAAPTVAEPPPPPVDDQQTRNRKAIERLKAARDSAAIAVSQGSETSRAKAFHELEAAMVSIENRFDIWRLTGAEEHGHRHSFRMVLEYYVRYVDSFYPLLRDDYVQQARTKALAFTNPFVEDDEG